MSQIRNFEISDEIFGGYMLELEISNFNSKQDICNIIINSLKNILISSGLTTLAGEVDRKKFHIHDITMEDIRTGYENQKFWVCGFCKNENEF
jgi:hypothetical protein